MPQELFIEAVARMLKNTRAISVSAHTALWAGDLLTPFILSGLSFRLGCDALHSYKGHTAPLFEVQARDFDVEVWHFDVKVWRHIA